MPERSPQLSLAEQVDAECDRYEAAFRDRRKPLMEAFLAGVDSTVRPALFRALLELDLELRIGQGETPRLSDYDQRFPDDRSTIQAIFDQHARGAATTSSVKLTEIETSRGPEPKGSPAKTSAAAPPPGKLGRFEIRSRLGEGAFGTVYRARDPQLDRDVALKVPRFTGKQSREERERFLREARAAAGLHHAHICPVHEVGTIDGRDYIVLAFIDGKPLSKLLQAQPRLSGRQVATVVRKLALALHDAHEQGIIHRDLKPANIMINRKGEPVIMDFGLARRDNSGDAQISHSGQIMGTPAYMSPEQARGDGKAVGPASDIYSLGVVLYELLSGRRPFEGTVSEVIGQILHVEPQQPSQFRADVDPRLQTICMRAIAKQPSDRFASMKEFAAALADYARATPVEARPSVPAVETGKELPTNQFADLLAAISSDVESKLERAVSKVGHVHRPPWWTYLVGSGLMGLVVLLGILFFIRKDTVTVIVNIPIENIHDPSLSFVLDGKDVQGELFAKPIELQPGKHELIVNKYGKLFKKFAFDVRAAESGPVVPEDMTPIPEPVETPIVIEDDLARWQGTWRCVGGNIDAQVITEEHARRDGYVQIVDKHSVIRILGGTRFPASFTLDPTANPKHYDSDLAVMGHPGGPFRHSGLYEFDGDRLRLILRYRPVEKPIERATWDDRGKPGIIYFEYVRDTTKDGFTSLFNGKDLTGWRPTPDGKANWRVEDGQLLAGHAGLDPAERCYLTTIRDDYSNYQLRAEVMLDGSADSGTYLRMQPLPGGVVKGNERGYEVQLNLEPRTNVHAGGLFVVPAPPDQPFAAHREERLLAKPNKWFVLEVTVRNGRITTAVNGTTASDYTDPNIRFARGHIGLQYTRGLVKFRRIEIKELSSDHEGWIDLFNGKDLTGWEVRPSRNVNWEVGNEILSYRKGPRSHLLTDRDYQEFHLKLEMRQNRKANSGIWFWCLPTDDYPIGFETEISATQPLFAGSVLRYNPKGWAEAFHAPKDRGAIADRWVAVDVIVKGGRVKTIINGITGVDVELPGKYHNGGRIALQSNDNDTEVEFRNIRIQEFTKEQIKNAKDLDRKAGE